ncbi:Zinc finger protein [Termitomyces sp. T112]|nr:Zinc finger protein [Termitomyces sp. T112]
MSRARKMLIQRRETLVLAVAQIALIRGSVPCCVGGVVGCLGVGVGRGGSEETRGVGDDVGAVPFTDFGVDDTTREAGDAGARFEVEEHGGDGDEGQGTAFTAAGDVARAGCEELWKETYRSEVARTLERAPACGTVVVLRRLAVVLVKPCLVDEEAVAVTTPIVRVIVMVLKFIDIVKMLIAALAVVMEGELNPMFFEPRRGGVVPRGVRLVLI